MVVKQTSKILVLWRLCTREETDSKEIKSLLHSMLGDKKQEERSIKGMKREGRRRPPTRMRWDRIVASVALSAQIISALGQTYSPF